MRPLLTIERYLFAPAPLAVLGYCRAAFYGWLFLFYLPLVQLVGSQDISAFADVDRVFWQPVFPFALLGYAVLPHPWIDLLVIVFRISLLAACLGLFTRTCMLLAFVTGTYVIGLPNNFGSMSHTGGIVVIALGVMALSRAGDAFSLDALWRRRRRDPPPAPGGEYRWPIRFIWILLATAYFVSGASKLMANGLDYLHPDMMASFLRQRSFAWQTRPFTGWGLALADYPWICAATSAWTLFAETGFWLVLISRRARALLVPAMFLTHVGIALLLGPQFFQWMALLVFLVPWPAKTPQPPSGAAEPASPACAPAAPAFQA